MASHFGKLNGAFVARITKPGKSITSANMDDFALHENMLTPRGTIKGTASVPGQSSFSFTDTRLIGKSTYVLLKCDLGIFPMNHFTHITYYMTINPATGDVNIVNKLGGDLVIDYFIFTNIEF